MSDRIFHQWNWRSKANRNSFNDISVFARVDGSQAGLPLIIYCRLFNRASSWYFAVMPRLHLTQFVISRLLNRQLQQALHVWRQLWFISDECKHYKAIAACTAMCGHPPPPHTICCVRMLYLCWYNWEGLSGQSLYKYKYKFQEMITALLFLR